MEEETSRFCVPCILRKLLMGGSVGIGIISVMCYNKNTFVPGMQTEELYKQ